MPDFNPSDFVRKANEVIVIDDPILGTLRFKTLTGKDLDELRKTKDKTGEDMVILETWCMLNKVTALTVDDLKSMGVDMMTALAKLTHEHLDFRDSKKPSKGANSEASGQ